MTLDHFTCRECGSQFDSKKKLSGHKGGAHSRELVPLNHGTEYGYLQHLRRGIPIDSEDSCGCRAAHAQFHSARRNSER